MCTHTRKHTIWMHTNIYIYVEIHFWSNCELELEYLVFRRNRFLESSITPIQIYCSFQQAFLCYGWKSTCIKIYFEYWQMIVRLEFETFKVLEWISISNLGISIENFKVQIFNSKIRFLFFNIICIMPQFLIEWFFSFLHLSDSTKLSCVHISVTIKTLVSFLY